MGGERSSGGAMVPPARVWGNLDGPFASSASADSGGVLMRSRGAEYGSVMVPTGLGKGTAESASAAIGGSALADKGADGAGGNGGLVGAGACTPPAGVRVPVPGAV